ncbi:hypothetical protein DUNSADRAFT_15458 [Dunaliella salina]|uniref:Complex 1 LYR protein domain-containing protein n=1 Tax=Dunaliella salina TaxID=3046 RepID=A0ABQ7G5D2_DUNSA|nr:hypothetical protein DUNSADRAFT_15458 [Dunaliella salina]|eukprot:KAF5829817.1 hypothetical protein DUNSADRAFT_15458 [Dunaliella salina]
MWTNEPAHMDLLREAKFMPTENRATFIQKNVRHSFRENRALEGQQQEAALQLAEVQLDNVRAQKRHLNWLKDMGYLKC